MCGIIGSASYGKCLSEESIRNGATLLAHRGPDDSGFESVLLQGDPCTQVLLGHRRLSIIDLSPGGHQPMNDPQTGNWIIFNGEIYNFAAIKAELSTLGASFNSKSDTEVILKAYAAWGDDCVKKLSGMFTFAIWDAQRRRMFFARDRFGEKPLYYKLSGTTLVFASEIRALLKSGLVDREFDSEAISQFLLFGSVSSPSTIIKGIRSLLPAHIMVWERGEVRTQRYWDLNTRERELASGSGHHRPCHPRDPDELKGLLLTAVNGCTVSDVPVGAFLSGGIDSSAIVALLRQCGHQSISTFSIVFRELDYTEAQYSSLVAQIFGTDHHEIVLSQSDAKAALPQAIGCMDQPTVDGVNTYIVARETARTGIKVALSGLGGDELFAGYSSFRSVPELEKLAWVLSCLSPAVREKLAHGFGRLFPRNARTQKLAALISGEVDHPYLLTRALFLPGQISALTSASCVGQSMDNMLRYSARFDPVNRVSYLELNNYMSNTLLRDTDTMSMAHSLEVRAPFVDHKLAEYMFTVRGAKKLAANVVKPMLLRELVGLLPERVSHRPKRGFTLPFEYWMKDEMRQEVESVLFDEKLLGGILKTSTIQTVWSDFLQGRTGWSRPWSLYVLKKWTALNMAS